MPQHSLVDDLKFKKKAKEANTLIDSFYIMGANQSQLDQQMLSDLEKERDPIKRKALFDANIKVDILN